MRAEFLLEVRNHPAGLRELIFEGKELLSSHILLSSEHVANSGVKHPNRSQLGLSASSRGSSEKDLQKGGGDSRKAYLQPSLP